MTSYETDQETFWAGKFGKDYIERNEGQRFIEIAKHQFEHCFNNIKTPDSILEFGSNIGNNIEALKEMYPNIYLGAVELNSDAATILKNKHICRVYNDSILNFSCPEKFELTFTCGVLIHISPEHLPNVYKNLYQASKRYILIVEYYNHSPEEIDYRGHKGKLYRRDFAGEFIDQHKDTKIVDYGFLYHRDPHSPRKEDMNWFLIEKVA